MTYRHYIVKKRAKFNAICGQINLSYGTHLEAKDGFIRLGGKPVCSVMSQRAYDFFAQNDDENGEKRGNLTTFIVNRLAKRDQNHQKRWDKIQEDETCQQYRRSDHADYWLWSYDFYNAPIQDLQHIKKLINF